MCVKFFTDVGTKIGMLDLMGSKIFWVANIIHIVIMVFMINLLHASKESSTCSTNLIIEIIFRCAIWIGRFACFFRLFGQNNSEVVFLVIKIITTLKILFDVSIFFAACENWLMIIVIDLAYVLLPVCYCCCQVLGTACTSYCRPTHQELAEVVVNANFNHNFPIPDLMFQEIVNSFPTYHYTTAATTIVTTVSTTATTAATTKDEKLCPICIEHYESGSIIKTLPCMHNYHSACIDRWLYIKAICPLCKQNVCPFIY